MTKELTPEQKQVNNARNRRRNRRQKVLGLSPRRTRKQRRASVVAYKTTLKEEPEATAQQ